jgi:predicted dehydrogenase
VSAVRVGVVGCGAQGRLHTSFLAADGDADLVAICDRDRERARALAAELGVAGVYRDHREMLGAERLDLVCICTMPDSHREIAVDALEAGADVLCEKPMAHTLADAREMADAARRTGNQLAIGFNLRHSTVAQAVRGFIDEGALGAPVCARGSMLETEVPWWGPHQVKEISGGGAIAATAVHMIDLLMWFAGNPRPLTASASMRRLFPDKRGETVPERARSLPYDVEDIAFGHVRFESGFWLTIAGGWTWDAPGSECAFDLVGERAQASALPLHFWREESGELVDVTGGAEGGFDDRGSLAAELEEMVAAVRGGRPPALTSAQQGLEVQAVVDALYRSAAADREVEVADVRRAPEAAA